MDIKRMNKTKRKGAYLRITEKQDKDLHCLQKRQGGRVLRFWQSLSFFSFCCYVTLFLAFDSMGMGMPSLYGQPKQSAHKLTKGKKMHYGYMDPKGALIRIYLSGMVCDFCARAMEKIMKKRKEVAGLNVSLEKRYVELSLKKGYKMANKLLKKLVGDAGYNVVRIHRQRR